MTYRQGQAFFAPHPHFCTDRTYADHSAELGNHRGDNVRIHPRPALERITPTVRASLFDDPSSLPTVLLLVSMYQWQGKLQQENGRGRNYLRKRELYGTLYPKLDGHRRCSPIFRRRYLWRPKASDRGPVPIEYQRVASNISVSTKVIEEEANHFLPDDGSFTAISQCPVNLTGEVVNRVVQCPTVRVQLSRSRFILELNNPRYSSISM